MPRLPLPVGFKLKVAVALACLREDIGYLRHYRRLRSAAPELKVILKDLNDSGYHVLRGYHADSLCAEVRGEIDPSVSEYPDHIDAGSGAVRSIESGAV